jgi:UDP-glucose 4-epimerase
VGTGRGYSVKEMIDAAKRITGKDIKSEITGRREGDPARLVAENTKAMNVLGWSAKYGLDEIISTAWNWYMNRKF